MTNRFVAIGLPSVDVGVGDSIPDSAANTGKPPEETVYKFPPVVWMFIFLIAGYVGVRFMLED